ncbi:lactococcin 972 family bacteriocin [Leifsonia sp. L25]|uniref:lactococcin 972 family bacteriocin n=1 Tax=Actinomycetes TaxID=1760 RepID=UPI003D69C4C4
MEIWTKAVASTAVAGALLVGGATAAQATSVSVEGGTWNYGVTGKYTYSDYLHKSRTHKSTACGAGCAYASWTSPGAWSKAQAISAIGGNTAYYDVK